MTLMAASGDTIEMRVEFEQLLTDEKIAERCRAIAEFLEYDDD